MGRRRSSNEGSEREKKWEKIFNALVKLSQNLQKDRQFLEERIKSLNEVIYQMKMEQKIASSEAELVLVLKDEEAFTYKHRYENAESDLSDFREWFDYLCNNRSNDGIDKEGGENEVKKLKSEIEKHKKMESDFGKQLRKKCEEVERIIETMHQLVERGEQLQSANEKLRSENDEMKAESVQKSEEISRLTKEIEVLRSRPGNGMSSIQGKLKNESDTLHTSEKTARAKPIARKSTGGKAPKKQFMKKGSSSHNLKRKSKDAIIIPDTPRLFSSSFKVPKLKHPSSSSSSKTQQPVLKLSENNVHLRK